MALPRWPYIFSNVIGIWLIGVWAVCNSQYAHTLCESVGFPQPRDQPFNSFYYLFANKEGIMGLIFLTLQLAGEWKAVGIALGCACVGGVGDAYLSMTVGSMSLSEAFQAHGLVTVLAAWASLSLMRENW